MERTIIARTMQGSEFIYSTKSAHGVAKAKAAEVCSVLNNLRWKLSDGEVWHIYTVDEYDTAYYVADSKKFIYHRGGGITERCSG